MFSEDGHSWPKHVKAVNIYKLNHTGRCFQLFYNSCRRFQTNIVGGFCIWEILVHNILWFTQRHKWTFSCIPGTVLQIFLNSDRETFIKIARQFLFSTTLIHIVALQIQSDSPCVPGIDFSRSVPNPWLSWPALISYSEAVFWQLLMEFVTLFLNRTVIDCFHFSANYCLFQIELLSSWFPENSFIFYLLLHQFCRKLTSMCRFIFPTFQLNF
jgi:hypothetical protein